jgi:hypothetical protein
MVDATASNTELSGPRGRKPRRALSRRNIIIYGLLGMFCL